ncbi:alpha/beta hydrolase [Hyphomicrobium sp.]|uniref:alpha/beta hydrolase n=1 Tax=Hyphomicrobium sp. TaxID=82 RepID=UPI003F711DA8
MLRRPSGLLALIVWLAVSSVGSADVLQDCESGELSTRVQACTEIIVAGDTASERLVEAHLFRARAYAELGKIDSAISDSDKAIALDPNKARSYVAKALVLRLAGDVDRALAELAHAITLDPKLASAYQERALVHRLRGDGDQAETDEAMASQLNASGSSSPDDALVERGPVPGVDEAADEPYDAVPVFFGTDRKQASGTERASFAGARARALVLGKALVTIPKDHYRAIIERPWALSIFGVTLLELSEDPRRHFTIQDIGVLSREKFIEAVRQQLGASQTFKDQAFIFVHGYNVSFENALYRTAQIAYDIGFDGVPFLYSWPSGGGLTGYLYDKDSADQSVDYLRNFIELVATQSKATKVHLIAHSMGNAALLRTLEKIQLAGGLKGGAVVSQIILAAPDIDRDVFETLATNLGSFAQGVTLYASSSDKALIASRTVAGGVARAGDVPAPPSTPLVVAGVETIDVTATSTEFFGLNHSGFAEKAALLQDLGVLLMDGTHPPDARGTMMERIEQGAAAFWRYRNEPPKAVIAPK